MKNIDLIKYNLLCARATLFPNKTIEEVNEKIDEIINSMSTKYNPTENTIDGVKLICKILNDELTMKETRNTIDGVELNSQRRAGNSTRQVNCAINLLFKGFKVEVKDHWDYGTNKRANLSLFDKILDRLQFEHGLDENKIIIDRKNLTLELI